jgi:hypothetical protein
MKDNEQLRLKRAKEAEALLGNPMVKDLMFGEKERLFTAWADSLPEDKDKRENLYAEYRGLKSVIRRLHGYVTDGKLLAEQVKDNG